MKKLLLIMLVLTISACSKSDDSETLKDEASIAGVWTLVKEKGESGTWELPWEDDSVCNGTDRVIFLSNGNFTHKSYGEVVINQCELTMDNVGYWELNSDVISIMLVEDKVDGDIDGGFIDDYKIFELTNNKLILGEYEPNVTVKYFYEFEKVEQ